MDVYVGYKSCSEKRLPGYVKGQVWLLANVVVVDYKSLVQGKALWDLGVKSAAHSHRVSTNVTGVLP